MTEQERAQSTLPAPRNLDVGRDALFLDFDGVLVDLAERPEAVSVRPGLVADLTRLRSLLDGALAIVTGRGAEEVDAFLAPLRPALAAQHGRVLRLEGDADVAERRQSLPEASRAAVAAVARAFPGVLIEDKGDGVAIHYRASPDAADAVRAAAAAAVDASDGRLQALPGKMVVELVPPGHDKGTGIAALMARPPFAGRTPVFAGDDITDEAGFRAVQAMGGVGVIVAERRPTEAVAALADVAAVHAWLAVGADVPLR